MAESTSNAVIAHTSKRVQWAVSARDESTYLAMTSETTTSTAAVQDLPSHPREFPAAVIRCAQDCIDFGTIEFDVGTVVDQGAKRSVVGECVVSDRLFEAVYLHRDSGVKDASIDSAAPLSDFKLDRIWQYEPEKVEVRLPPDCRYSALREQSVSLGDADADSLGPVTATEPSAYERLQDTLHAVLSTDEAL